MGDWSSSESEVGWSTEESTTGWATDESTTGWSSDESTIEWSIEGHGEAGVRDRGAGRRVVPTVRWALGVFRDSPLVVALALVAGGSPLFAPDNALFRSSFSLLTAVIVTAVAAVVAGDAIKGRDRSIRAQLADLLRALPGLGVMLAGVVVLLYLLVFLPTMLVPYLGIAFGLAVAVYLLSMLTLVVPSVVLDRSINKGQAALSEARFLAVGLLAVFVLGHGPIAYVLPRIAEPTLAIGLALWAGVLTGVASLACTKVYFENCPEKISETRGHLAREALQQQNMSSDGLISNTD